MFHEGKLPESERRRHRSAVEAGNDPPIRSYFRAAAPRRNA